MGVDFFMEIKWSKYTCAYIYIIAFYYKQATTFFRYLNVLCSPTVWSNKTGLRKLPLVSKRKLNALRLILMGNRPLAAVLACIDDTSFSGILCILFTPNGENVTKDTWFPPLWSITYLTDLTTKLQAPNKVTMAEKLICYYFFEKKLKYLG